MAARGRKKGTVSGLKQYNLLMPDGTIIRSIYAHNTKEAHETLHALMPYGMKMNSETFKKAIKQGGLPYNKNLALLAPGVTEEDARKIASQFNPEPV